MFAFIQLETSQSRGTYRLALMCGISPQLASALASFLIRLF